MPARGARPFTWLRGLALSAERLAAQGIASGAVRGAADELQARVPDDVDERVRALLQKALETLERLATEEPGSRSSPLASWSQTIAEAVIRGTILEFRRMVPEMRPTTQDIFARLKQWLDRTAAEASARAQEIRSPGDRARVAAAGAIAGATEQLRLALPALAPPAADFAAQVGRGVVHGAAEELGRQLRAASRPLARGAVAAGAALVLVLAVRRR